MEEEDFNLDATDLFMGLPGSPRKTDTHDEGLDNTKFSFELKERVSSSPLGKVLACARLSRKDSEESLAEMFQEYRVHSPLVRRSKSLLMRRVASDVCNASPLTQYLKADAVPVKRRCLPFSVKERSSKTHRSSPVCQEDSPKPSPIQKVKSEDRLSDGGRESGASSGCESASIETDDEATNRMESLHSEESTETPVCEDSQNDLAESEGVNLDDSVSVIMNVPFKKLAMRQDSELFEEPSERNGCLTNPFLDTEDKQVLKLDRDDYPFDSECRIKSAVERLNTRAVIGDGTMTFALPCIPGRHGSHKYITVDILAQLHNGHFADAVDHFVIIDCRYPYEYSGGHIKGAINMYCGDSVEEIMSWKVKKDNSALRTVLIFHCEFSSQRAPTMMRLLRNADRERNSHCYPYLCYPEIYLLSGGYKLFFQKYPELCEPRSYTPMNHRDHLDDLKLFRSRATTWHGEVKLQKHANSLIF